MSPIINRLAGVIDAFEPDVTIATYPVYPGFLRSCEHRCKSVKAPLSTTLVTDSITVHPIWLQGKTEVFYVSDRDTKSALESAGVPSGKVLAMGFPVPPSFSTALSDRPQRKSSAGIRVLFFPTRSRKDVQKQLGALIGRLGSDDSLTIVLGRHEKRLKPLVAPILASAENNAEITLYGWYPEAWRLMFEHDLLVCKAGGATVHEALAARIPILIDKVVPGQEEGNAELVRTLKAGIVAPKLDAFSNAVRELTAPSPTPSPLDKFPRGPRIPRLGDRRKPDRRRYHRSGHSRGNPSGPPMNGRSRDRRLTGDSRLPMNHRPITSAAHAQRTAICVPL